MQQPFHYTYLSLKKSMALHPRTHSFFLAFLHPMAFFPYFSLSFSILFFLMAACSPSYSKRHIIPSFDLTYLICKQIESTHSLNPQRPLLTKSSPASSSQAFNQISTKNAHPRGTFSSSWHFVFDCYMLNTCASVKLFR